MSATKLVGLLFAHVVLAGAIFLTSAVAETVKIGVINTYSGPFAQFGDQMEKGIKLYLKEHEKDLPSGLSIELIRRDDAGNPGKAREAAQQLIISDRVQVLTGLLLSSSAAEIAPLTAEEKIPFVLMGGTDPAITGMSPYLVRVSTTIPQETYPLGKWASGSFKTSYALLGKYRLGQLADEAFTTSFTNAGGKIVGSIFVPLPYQDITSYVVQMKQAKPDIAFVFLPPGDSTAGVLKAWRALGLKEAGINLALTQDSLPDDALRQIGDDALGIYSSGSYSVAATRPQNKAYVAAFKREFGDQAIPNVLSVQGWDGMAAIFDILKQTRGNFTGDQAMAILKRWRNSDSPRGPIMIDPETRDIVENIYIRRAEKLEGFVQNVEFAQFADVRSNGTSGGGDPCPLNQCRCANRSCSADCCNK